MGQEHPPSNAQRQSEHAHGMLFILAYEPDFSSQELDWEASEHLSCLKACSEVPLRELMESPWAG